MRRTRSVGSLLLLVGWLGTFVERPLWGAAPAAIPVLQLRVLGDDWGGASTENIQAVCASAGSELIKYFPGRKMPPITIGNNHQMGPIALFAKGSTGENQVLLNTQGTAWSQYSYQFGHELCHILCNYRNAKNPHLWFEESMCETASIFVVRKMSITWKVKPPYPNWKSYSKSLDDYVDDHMKRTAKMEEKTFAEWFQKNQAKLQKARTDRTLNQVVAVKALLPLLLRDPRHWEAVSSLNQWDDLKEPSFREYLLDWHERVAPKHKKFVRDVAKQFEITLE